MDDSKSNDEGWHLDSCYEDMSFVCQRPQGNGTATNLSVNCRNSYIQDLLKPGDLFTLFKNIPSAVSLD